MVVLTPVQHPSPIPMLDRHMGYPPSDSISSPSSGVGVGEFQDLSCVGYSASHLEQLLVKSISNLTKTFRDEMSNLENKMDTSFRYEMSNLKTDFSNLQSDFNDRMCIVDSNIHVKVYDIETKVIVLGGNFNQLDSKIDTLDNLIWLLFIDWGRIMQMQMRCRGYPILLIGQTRRTMLMLLNCHVSLANVLLAHMNSGHDFSTMLKIWYP